MYDNLVYVNTEHNDIFKNLFAANELKHSSPQMSACLTRIILEHFVNRILIDRGILEGTPANVNRFLANRKFSDFTLAKNINRIEEADPEKRNLMHSIKEIGNHGAHGNDVSYLEADGNIRKLITLIKWFSSNKFISAEMRAECNYILGKVYECELTVDIDNEESLRYFFLAAEEGNVLAQRDIGYAYYNGIGVPKNISLSEKWLKLAAKQNSKDARCLLAIIGLNNTETAKSIFEELANDGHIVAKFNLAILNYKDFQGGSEITFRILNELNEQAVDGPGLSIVRNRVVYKLAECHSMGIGTEINHSKAFELFMKLAKKNDLDAQYRVGIAYARGKGIEKNIQEAIKWLDKAAQAQHQLAREELSKLKMSF